MERGGLEGETAVLCEMGGGLAGEVVGGAWSSQWAGIPAHIGSFIPAYLLSDPMLQALF